MSEYENIPETNHPEKGKWFTYGGKVDETLMNMLKEAQKTAGIKKFSDFMNDMLNIYRENKQDTEPPQMQVIKKAVTDIIMSTESLLGAMQIVEADKFKSIAEYQQRAQHAEENALLTEDKISELNKEIAHLKKELVLAQDESKSVQTELVDEIERRKSIEGMIKRIQRIADDAVVQKEKAELERDNALNTAIEVKNKAASLEAANQDLQVRINSIEAAVKQSQEELLSERNINKMLNQSLTRETIARNRLEERLQMMEPQIQASNEKIESLQVEIGNLRLNEQALLQKVSILESETQTFNKP
ncbi:chromosome partition protein Smc [Sporomusaceae bacterium FL31]|nr:chromosome partition protein Smc [Sporomusaceae bacterium FL31]GCE33560.1 chromosome partition protein Smc [Sporomusaceae bacterium]